jgi:hypothetical protein
MLSRKQGTILSFHTYVGSLQNTVYQDPLHNKRLYFDWLTFYVLLLCTRVAGSVLWSVTLMRFPDDDPIRDRNM